MCEVKYAMIYKLTKSTQHFTVMQATHPWLRSCSWL